jgi:DNA-binding response OmpR family regulator
MGRSVARGFALYVGLDEVTAEAHNVSLAEVVAKLKSNLDVLIPGLSVETFAAVALAPADVAGNNLEVVRTALSKPAKSETLFVMDLNRKELQFGDIVVDLSWREFALLNHFAENSDRILPLDEIAQVLWPDNPDVPYQLNSIKTAMFRMFSKLGLLRNSFYAIRGQGYVFHKSTDFMVIGNTEKEKV